MTKQKYIFFAGILIVLILSVLSILPFILADDFVNGFNSQTGVVREGGLVPLSYSGNIKCESVYCSFKMQSRTSNGEVIETWITLYDGSEIKTDISSSTGVIQPSENSFSIYTIYYALSSEGWGIWRNVTTPCKNCTFFPGDYDGDGTSDILGYSNKMKQGYFVLSSDWSTWHNFDVPGCSEASSTCNLIPVTGDFDGDGKSDFVAYDSSGGFGYLLSLENYLVWRTGETPCKNCSIISGDYNGDEISDFVAYDKVSKSIHYALSPNWEWKSVGVPCADCTFFPGDYNGDGISDIVGYDKTAEKLYVVFSESISGVAQSANSGKPIGYGVENNWMNIDAAQLASELSANGLTLTHVEFLGYGRETGYDNPAALYSKFLTFVEEMRKKDITVFVNIVNWNKGVHLPENGGVSICDSKYDDAWFSGILDFFVNQVGTDGIILQSASEWGDGQGAGCEEKAERWNNMMANRWTGMKSWNKGTQPTSAPSGYNFFEYHPGNLNTIPNGALITTDHPGSLEPLQNGNLRGYANPTALESYASTVYDSGAIAFIYYGFSHSQIDSAAIQALGRVVAAKTAVTAVTSNPYGVANCKELGGTYNRDTSQFLGYGPEGHWMDFNVINPEQLAGQLAANGLTATFIEYFGIDDTRNTATETINNPALMNEPLKRYVTAMRAEGITTFINFLNWNYPGVCNNNAPGATGIFSDTWYVNAMTGVINSLGTTDKVILQMGIESGEKSGACWEKAVRWDNWLAQNWKGMKSYSPGGERTTSAPSADWFISPSPALGEFAIGSIVTTDSPTILEYLSTSCSHNSPQGGCENVDPAKLESYAGSINLGCNSGFIYYDYGYDGKPADIGAIQALGRVAAKKPQQQFKSVFESQSALLSLPLNLCEDCNILPISGDFDGDRKTEFVAYNPLSGSISYLLSSQNYLIWGGGDTPCKNCTVINGDYDRDGLNDLVLYSSYFSCTPVNGYWGDWGAWSDVGSCGGESGFPCKQKQSRTRTCIAPTCGGVAGCSGTELEPRYINCGDGSDYGCPSGKVCSNGGCVSCTPSCAGKTCGDNGCGGSCGSCSSAAGEFCSGNKCMTHWYLDYDNDNFGNNISMGCWDGDIIQPDSTTKPYKNCNGGIHYYVKNNLDCNFTNPNVNPEAPEICDGIDNNCNGQVDDEGCINNADWTNLVGEKITRANINDTVLMSMDGTNLNNKNINYKISGPETFLWVFTKIVRLSSSDSPSWIANKSGSPFIFNISIIKNNVFITSKKSGELAVNNTYNNFLPVAIITAPLNELNVSVGRSINFNQSSYDEDDLLKITWNFGDGTTQIITNYVNNSAIGGNSNYTTSANVIHAFSSSGRYIVKLTIEEMIRGQKDSKEVVVNVFSSGINVFPVISSPNNETKEQPRIVLFDASKSFVVNCSLDNIGSDIITSENIFYCKYLHAPGASINSSRYELKMNWTINGDASPMQVVGDWSSNYLNVVSFRKAFSLKGNHNLSLTMTYMARSVNISKTINRNFKIESLWDCSSDGSYWTNDRYEPVRNNCSYKQQELGHTCCPAGKKCSSDGSCKGYANYCWQYPDKSSCELFLNYVPEKSATLACSIKQDYVKNNITNQYCSNLTSCLCKWDSNSSKCVEGINSTKVCWQINSNGEVEDITNENYGECLWSTTGVVDNCNSSNEMVTKKKALWVSKNNAASNQPDWCKDTEVSYPCVITEQLPFFDKIGLIIAILLIIFAYLYVLRRKEKIVGNIEKKINPKKIKRHK